MKLHNILFLAMIALFSFSSNLVQAEVNKLKHFVILIHGIGGNKNTFGYLERILNQENLNLTAKTFEYKTGSTLSTYEFAKDLNTYVFNLLQTEGTGNDKISLIMHSQGGIVGFLWLKYILDNKISYHKNLSSFITLSTPHWGADMAKVGKMFFYSLPEDMENPLSPFGRRELNEMSFGSGTINDMTQSIDLVFKKLPHVKVLNVGGIKRFYNSTLGEDDVVVPAYSMRSERYYLRDELRLFEKPKEPPVLFPDETHSREFVLVPAEHIKLDQAGIADIPESCFDIKKCQHPSLPTILNHLMGNKIIYTNNIELSQFRVTLFIKSDQLLEQEDKAFTIRVEGLNKDIQIPLIEKLSPHRGSAKNDDSVAFTFSGMSKLKDRQKINIVLNYKNSFLRRYEVPIRAGYSTFLDVFLKNE